MIDKLLFYKITDFFGGLFFYDLNVLSNEEEFNVNIALCAIFIEGDLWEARLRTAALNIDLQIDEYNRTDILLPELSRYGAVVVAMDGVAGLQTVRAIRAVSDDIALLWISDEDYSHFSYQNHVTHFLLKAASDAELQKALKHCCEERGCERAK